MTDATNPVEDAVMVPREPTPEMLSAAFDAFEIDNPKQFADGNEARRAIWSAMLAAAPTPTAAGEGEPILWAWKLEGMPKWLPSYTPEVAVAGAIVRPLYFAAPPTVPARKTMTLDLTDAEMAALDELAAKKDLAAPVIFRDSFRLYQAVEKGAASVTWHDSGPLGLPMTTDNRPTVPALDEGERATVVADLELAIRRMGDSDASWACLDEMKAALSFLRSQPAQEPVAWRRPNPHEAGWLWSFGSKRPNHADMEPLYASPPPSDRMLEVLRENSWDLRCFDVPTGGDDSDIGWRVVGHWQAEPRERTIAEVFYDDPAAAIRAALTPDNRSQEKGEVAALQEGSK